ncbi:hypothetical protein ABN763_05405 [Spongiivirga sp. MCCC 1A20706]|uniref:hypothetical protein n=1 Tax=Spongiivirga sp. MCCC 1A20706 TaxID=3160963 RepID=UPI0039777133
MNAAISGKPNKLALINLIIVAYFLISYLLYLLKIDGVLIGVIKELTTIPFLIAQVVFLVIGIITISKSKPAATLLLISVILLGICVVITLGSFF